MLPIRAWLPYIVERVVLVGGAVFVEDAQSMR
jgi:hypothetical protein